MQLPKYVVKILSEEQEKLRPRQHHLPAAVPIILHRGPPAWVRSTEMDDLLMPEQIGG